MSTNPYSNSAQAQGPISDLRIALVHEWLAGAAGSEQTFVAMAELLPNAELFALSHNPTKGLDFGARTVSTSALDRFCQDGGRAALLPFMPTAMKRLRRGREFDVVISSSHAFSRAFAAGFDGVHLSYTYTPVRYVWIPELERHRSRVRIPEPLLSPFRSADRRYARGVHSFAAISEEIRTRIRAVYGRDSRVVYPPCDTVYFSIADHETHRRGALVAGRLVSYKRVDLAIRACAQAGVDLTVIGGGPERSNLEELAQVVFPGHVHFAGSVSRSDLRQAYRSAQVVLFPGMEDFGIVPVEAQACGAPVVAFGAGGALETVFAHPNAFAAVQDASVFARLIGATITDPPSQIDCRRQAEKFSRRRFAEAFTAWVADELTDLMP